MDSNNTQKKELEINLKDAFHYILYKSWIVLLVTIFAVIIAFLYSNIFIKESYTSSSKVFITNESNSETPTTSSEIDWTLSKQYSLSAKEFITIDYLEKVADLLNSNALSTIPECAAPDGKSFSAFYSEITGMSKITAEILLNYISVSTNSSTCIMTVTANTPNPKLSAIITNAVAESFEDYLIDVLETTEVKAKRIDSGKVSSEPSNIHTTRNVLLGVVVGVLLSCGVLFLVFVFDDKIKSPEDVEKYLGLSVLGAIPELEKEI